jgi:Ser/Thr protein kinase RdoA (MazF antagonist)
MDGEVLVDLEMRLAAAYEQWLANPEAAIAAYNRAIDIDASNIKALERLEALYLSARAGRTCSTPTRRCRASPTPMRTPPPASSTWRSWPRRR